MEVENQVFGTVAGSYESKENLESEDFIFNIQNKEEAEKNIDSSSAELSDFIDSLIRDVPDPTEEEVEAGIDKILAAAYSEKKQPEAEKTHTEPVKDDQKKKITLKVLFLAAVLSLLSVSCLLAIGNSRNISIENGFMAFARETVQVVFFDEKEQEFISVDSLLADLESHGFGDILFPEEFVTNSDEYKVSVPEYKSDEFGQVLFEIYNGETKFNFGIYDYKILQQAFEYEEIKDMGNIEVNDICMYSSEINGFLIFEFVHENYRYYIQSNAPYSETIRIIKTID